jgi:hypothetical protein
VESAAVNLPLGMGMAYSTTNAFIVVNLEKTMRVIPTLVATATDWGLNDGVATVVLNAISILTGFAGKNKVVLQCSVASGLTQNRPYLLNANSANKKMIFDAEL